MRLSLPFEPVRIIGAYSPSSDRASIYRSKELPLLVTLVPDLPHLPQLLLQPVFLQPPFFVHFAHLTFVPQPLQAEADFATAPRLLVTFLLHPALLTPFTILDSLALS